MYHLNTHFTMPYEKKGGKKDLQREKFLQFKKFMLIVIKIYTQLKYNK